VSAASPGFDVSVIGKDVPLAFCVCGADFSGTAEQCLKDGCTAAAGLTSQLGMQCSAYPSECLNNAACNSTVLSCPHFASQNETTSADLACRCKAEWLDGAKTCSGVCRNLEATISGYIQQCSYATPSPTATVTPTSMPSSGVRLIVGFWILLSMFW